jgi:hypothetical protein
MCARPSLWPKVLDLAGVEGHEPTVATYLEGPRWQQPRRCPMDRGVIGQTHDHLGSEDLGSFAGSPDELGCPHPGFDQGIDAFGLLDHPYQKARSVEMRIETLPGKFGPDTGSGLG